MAEINDLAVYKGSAFTQPFKLTPKPAGGIAGWTIAFTLKKKATAATALIARSCDIVTDGAADGEDAIFSVSLSHDDTTLMSAADYVYDVQRTDPGSEDVLSIGKFSLLQEVLYP